MSSFRSLYKNNTRKSSTCKTYVQPQLQLLAGAVGEPAGVHAGAVHHPRGRLQEPRPLPPLLRRPPVLHRLQDRPDGLHHDCCQPVQVEVTRGHIVGQNEDDHRPLVT